MRKIKFRAWVKKERQMAKVLSLETRNEGTLFVEYKDKTKITLGKFAVELMQYTGLKDIAGNEIYEGDIVKDVSDGTIGHVEYSDGGYVIVYDDIMEKLNADESAYLEVVGNIFENPELLGEG